MNTLSAVFLFFSIFIAYPLHADQITNLLAIDASHEESNQDSSANKVIEVNTSRQTDKKIQTRLQKIFSEIAYLARIKVHVSNGIVTLEGQVNTTSAENKALQLAEQVVGVVEVENQLVINHDLEDRLENTWIKLVKTLKSVLTSLPIVLMAITAFALFWIIGRWLSRRQSLYRKIAPNYFLANLLGQITQLIFILFGLIFALSLLDLTALLGSILGAAGIMGLAVGFAVKDTVENYIASILLSLRNPFEVNDLVSVNGIEGNVVRLTTRATILLSLDGNHIRIPNSSVFKAVIINYTRNAERRFEFDVGIDPQHDLLAVKTLALEVLNSIEGVLNDPKPMVSIEALGDFSVILRIYGWTDQEKYDFLKVKSETIRQIKQAFDQENIVMPEPTYRILKAEEANVHAVDEDSKQSQSLSADQQPRMISDITVDVSVDNTIEKKATEELARSEVENLLDKNAAQE